MSIGLPSFCLALTGSPLHGHNGVMRCLYLLGLKHSGKSSLGRWLAGRWKWPFYDLDEELSREDPEGRGWDARTIYARLGPQVFRRWEARAAERLATLGGNYILALGGGSVENEAAMAALDRVEGRQWVWIEEDEETLLRRILAGGMPAFLDPERPRESFTELAARRRALALKYCPKVLEARGRGIEDCALEIERWRDGCAG